MTYYPVFLRVAGRPCAVIGGGEVAERKARALLAAGAHVTVISPQVTPELARLAGANRLAHRPRAYARGDLDGCRLAIAATDDPAAQAAIAADAEAAGVLLNVVDQPAHCTFIAPSVVVRGDLVVAVSSGGASPALTRYVREEIERVLGPEYESAAALLGRVRALLRERAVPSAERQRRLRGLVNGQLLASLRARDASAVDRLLAEHVGEGVSLAALGLGVG
jgi:precorrin-2 dehydrogenase/sirohydrochlorin ferrochelatase